MNDSRVNTPLLSSIVDIVESDYKSFIAQVVSNPNGQGWGRMKQIRDVNSSMSSQYQSRMEIHIGYRPIQARRTSPKGS